MHVFWFLLNHVVFLFFFSSSLVQCKSKKKFQSDGKARLVDPNAPGSPQSVKDFHRPVSQAPPTLMPIESPKSNVADDTLANVVSIQPDFSRAPPPHK